LDASRYIKQALDAPRSVVESELISSKTMAQMQRAKLELERNLEEFNIRISHRLH